MKRSIGSLKGMLVAGLLALSLGCGSDTPIAPEPVQPAPQPQASLLGSVTGLLGGVTGTVGGVVEGTTGLVGGVLNTLLSPVVCPTNQTYSDSQVIGYNGGTLRVGPHTLTIPYGALTANTRITATAPRGSYAEVQFQPHGLTFKRDVTVSISYEQCGLLKQPTPPVIVYTDDARNILEILQSTIDTRRKTITGKTDHFSSYILAER